jgi:hypothetical protein
MISWGTILYGAALSAILAGAAFAVALRLTRPVVILTGAIAAAAGPVAWNAILRAVDASEFFVDAPIGLFPVSWQDTGSGIFTLAASCLALGLGPLRNDPGQRVARYGLLAALAALLVDVYLY